VTIQALRGLTLLTPPPIPYGLSREELAFYGAEFFAWEQSVV